MLNYMYIIYYFLDRAKLIHLSELLLGKKFRSAFLSVFLMLCSSINWFLTFALK